jgi:hypothetical protein
MLSVNVALRYNCNMEDNSKAVQAKISAIYQSARTLTILLSKGQARDIKGHELAVDGKDVAALQRIAAVIASEAKTPDDVFELAIRHGLIKEVK